MASLMRRSRWWFVVVAWVVAVNVLAADGWRGSAGLQSTSEFHG